MTEVETRKRSHKRLHHSCAPTLHQQASLDQRLDALLLEIQSEVKESRKRTSRSVLSRGSIRLVLLAALGFMLLTSLGSTANSLLRITDSEHQTYSAVVPIQSRSTKEAPTIKRSVDGLSISSSDPQHDMVLDTTRSVSPSPWSDPSRNYRILSLGGSTTWGAKLESRAHAYPHVLAQWMGPNWSAVNLAMRATGASYASQCIESMVRDSSESHQDFDVILLEFSLNGLEGLPLLLKRLRRRYPHAIVVYVHLWSLRMLVHNQNTGEKPRLVLNQGLHFTDADKSIAEMLSDPTVTWTWSNGMVGVSEQVKMDALDAARGVHGFVYELALPNNPKAAMNAAWFGADFHHLGSEGHHVVAAGIYELLQNPRTRSPPPLDLSLNSQGWGNGDQCVSWFETGLSKSVDIVGGTMQMFVEPDKWALQVGQDFGSEASLHIWNDSSETRPVELVLMSWGDPSVYPKFSVTLASPGQRPIESHLDPLNPVVGKRIYHVTRTIRVGVAEPGRNTLRIVPSETAEFPLRVTGIVMCGACVEMDTSYLNEDTMYGESVAAT